MRLLKQEIQGLLRLFRPRFLFFTGLAALIPDQCMPALRANLYRLAGCDISRGVSILGKIRFVGAGNFPGRLHIGWGTIVGIGTTFGLDDHITIGVNVSVSPFCTLYTATHALGFGSRRMGHDTSTKPLSIEDGAWICMNSVILPGVTIGRGSVVSAGAVVNESIPSNTLAEGNPAVVTKKLPFGNR